MTIGETRRAPQQLKYTRPQNTKNALEYPLSMLFTIVSILISVFEYALLKKTAHGEMTCTIGVRFTLHCSEMSKLDPLEFRSRVQFRQQMYHL